MKKAAKTIIWLFLGLPILVFFLFLRGPIVEAQRFYKVERVLDGETIALAGGPRVRLLGVNASAAKLGHFTKASVDYIRRVVEGKQVRLQFDPLARGQDMQRRLQAYVFLEDGTHLNAEIIRNGYAFAAYREPATEHQGEFRNLEQEARDRRRGFWGVIR